MTFTCAHCGQRFTSVILDKDAAMIKASSDLVQHCIKSHPDIIGTMQQKLASVLQMVSSKLTLSMLIDLEALDQKDDRQNYIVDKYNQIQLDLANALDMDIMTEEEIDDNEDPIKNYGESNEQYPIPTENI
jgi:hypothetical protein